MKLPARRWFHQPGRRDLVRGVLACTALEFRYRHANRHSKDIATAGDRADQFLLVIAENAPDFQQALRQGIVRDRSVLPDSVDQFVF